MEGQTSVNRACSWPLDYERYGDSQASDSLTLANKELHMLFSVG